MREPPIVSGRSTMAASKSTKVRKASANPQGKTGRKPKDEKARKLSALDAAAKVLAATDGALNCMEMIEAMAAKGYWRSPGGKTPASTLFSAILREISTKGAEARFRKSE